MKKTIALILGIILVLSLTACGKSAEKRHNKRRSRKHCKQSFFNHFYPPNGLIFTDFYKKPDFCAIIRRQNN